MSGSHCNKSSYIEDSLAGPPDAPHKAVHVSLLHQFKTLGGIGQAIASSNCSEIPGRTGTLLEMITPSV